MSFVIETALAGMQSKKERKKGGNKKLLKRWQMGAPLTDLVAPDPDPVKHGRVVSLHHIMIVSELSESIN